ncbi:Beta-glucoside bgl operon antiterminator BglGfamily [Lactiplantibacillus plantarum]|nr:Beta-glucoside bgl operon antiterminator BglGfamily [Lactiplantibacillus plantarum]
MSLLFDHLLHFNCKFVVQKIAVFVKKSTEQTVSVNERIYLIMHIQRMLNENQ